MIKYGNDCNAYTTYPAVSGGAMQEYVVHPAFDSVNEATSGFWVGKFESSHTGCTTDASTGITNTNTTALTLQIKPGVTSWREISISNMFDVCLNMNNPNNSYGLPDDTISDPHLMKNSEWGAVAYLSKSQYGLGATDITVNNISLESSTKSVYAVTGCTSNSTTDNQKETTIETIKATTGNTASGGVYTWDQLTGTTASCTGSIYGIYDLSGGAWERTTGYVANGKGQLKDYGAAIAYEGDTLRTISTKYTTVYPHNSTYDSTSISDTETNLNTASTNNWLANTLIYGDAIRETSTGGTGNTSWYGDASNFPGLNNPFSLRGASYYGGSAPGLFCFYRHSGGSAYNNGFRAVVVVP